MEASSAQSAITVHVNGEARALAPHSTVAELLRQLDLEGRRVAVAVNRDVVPRADHARAELAAGDDVEILEAVGGG